MNLTMIGTSHKKINLLKILSFSVPFLLIIAYFLWGSRSFITGPEIIISSPDFKNTVSNKKLIKIEGQAKESIKVMVNGRSIPVTDDGSFSDLLLLIPKYNIIKLTAVDRFEQEKTEEFVIFYDPV